MSFSTVRLDDTVIKIPEQTLGELASIYKQLDNSPVSCDICGHCCHFADYDHQLWITEIELAFLVLHHGLRRPRSAAVCPYMELNCCQARRGRALGCRVFSCKSDQNEMELLHEALFQQIRNLARKAGIDIHYMEFLDTLRRASVI